MARPPWPGRPAALAPRTQTGGQPLALSEMASAPSCRRASSKLPIGRCRIRGIPSIGRSRARASAEPSGIGPSCRCWPHLDRPLSEFRQPAAAAVIARRILPRAGLRAPATNARIVIPSAPARRSSRRYLRCRVRRSSSDFPSASAAQTNARLVMLFDPGGRIAAVDGPVGRISIVCSMLGIIAGE